MGGTRAPGRRGQRRRERAAADRSHAPFFPSLPSHHQFTADAARAHELIRSFVLEGLLSKGGRAATGAGAESYAE